MGKLNSVVAGVCMLAPVSFCPGCTPRIDQPPKPKSEVPTTDRFRISIDFSYFWVKWTSYSFDLATETVIQSLHEFTKENIRSMGASFWRSQNAMLVRSSYTFDFSLVPLANQKVPEVNADIQNRIRALRYRMGGFDVSRDDRLAWLEDNETDPNRITLTIVDMRTGELITEIAFSDLPGVDRDIPDFGFSTHVAWAPDGDRLAIAAGSRDVLSKNQGTFRSKLYLLDLKTKKVRLLGYACGVSWIDSERLLVTQAVHIPELRRSARVQHVDGTVLAQIEPASSAAWDGHSVVVLRGPDAEKLSSYSLTWYDPDFKTVRASVETPVCADIYGTGRSP